MLPIRTSWTMMSLIVVTLLSAQGISCTQTGPGTEALQAQVQRLQQRLDSAYTPGLGEFMSGIQVHHEKLWFAGKAANWELAGFELGEIKESLDDIRHYCTDRPEVASLPMILPPLDSLAAAVKKQDPAAFNSGFTLLTTTCNNCHQATKHGYNVIQVPTTPPFSNQVFSTK
ncbi:MAG TPA: hypothetical protein VHE34_02490 [Puia sp.]|uniref:hypothetical protein n=1 Tax=Puia sp. TaxID=2045100 RepID=UPI002B681DFC|nr:hypothetical protein [Puia sp.]HVU94056.1 hypothetical protein [Puia sp.]